uniref:alkaline phosphatase n=1 Tax=Photinus pyralis TaxID=7054 RepID=A0A1Y1MBS6_PHOPY
MMRAIIYLILATICATSAVPNKFHTSGHFHKNIREESASYWNEQAQARLKEQLLRRPNTGIAKNVILFIGDGMSMATLTATRIHLGQKSGSSGEETELSFDKFPYVGLSKTYCVNKQFGESACTATAYLGGVKSNENTIGVTAAVKNGDCDAMNNVSNHVPSTAHYSQLKGKRTGLVTTALVTEASPAGVYGHTAEREWHCDADVKRSGKDPKRCLDMATQLVHGATGSGLNVIFGGGRTMFLPNSKVDEDGTPGSRLDQRDLVKEWAQRKGNATSRYVSDREGLLNITDSTEYALGLFNSSVMDYNLERNKSKKPSLEEMTLKAIELLSNGNKGFFLFVEGALIDYAHHDNQARIALDETVEFHKAIEAAVKVTDERDTLIVVTADHSHSMLLSGGMERGHDILGVDTLTVDSLNYTTISYGTGPGYKGCENGRRYNVSKDNLTDVRYSYPTMVPLPIAQHGGDDVAIFARGPWAHLFSGVLEQNVIAHIINFASCVGIGATACD